MKNNLPEMERSKEAQEIIRQMAERLSEIDGTFSWDHQERVVLNYIEQQEARIAELEQRPAVPEGWKLVPTKEKLSDLLVVGTEILVGPIYAEKHGFVEGDVLTLVEGRFEYDNGLYTEDQRAPSVWNAEEQEFYSIFHLFENDLSGFLDCEVVGAVEGALLSAQPTKQRPAPAVQGESVAFDDYDPGLINDHGGGNVGWWQDYIRSEIERANEHWRAQIERRPAVQGEPASRVVPSRDDLIQCLLATHGQSEGITADAILSMLTAAPQPAEQHPAPDVAGLVEALKWLRGAINCTPENDKHQSGTWISTSHPRIKQIDELLATYRKQGGEA